MDIHFDKAWKLILLSHFNERMPFPVTLYQTLIEFGG